MASVLEQPLAGAELDAAIAALEPGQRLLVPMDAKTYHARPEISSSGVRYFRHEGELNYHSVYVAKTLPGKASDSYRLGTLFHLAMAQQDWRSQAAIIPSTLHEDRALRVVRNEWLGSSSKVSLAAGTELNFKAPSHRRWFELKQAEAAEAGKEWLTEAELELIGEQIQSIADNPATAWLMDASLKHEQVGFYRCPKTNLVLRGMADVLADNLIIDFKTSRFSTRRGFASWACSREVDVPLQLGHYSRVFGMEECAIVMVRNFLPAESLWFDIPAWKVRESLARHDAVLKSMSECYELNSWKTLGWGARNNLVEQSENYWEAM